jgi:glutathione S-transferase
MKLFYSPGACSLSPHIALRESGLKFDIERVNLAEKKTEKGTDYTSVNPKGYVPALLLDNGDLLTEAGVVVQYIADQAPEKKLAPPAGSMERYHFAEWLNFIATELHKSFGPLFKADTPEATKKTFRDRITTRLGYVDKQLKGKEYLTGNQFTVADGYLFTVLRWTDRVNFDLSGFPSIVEYRKRVEARPAVRETLQAEGLIKD